MWSGKCPVGEMSIRGNVLVEKCPVGEVSFGEMSIRGNVLVEKCPVGEVSFGEMSIGEVSVGQVSVGELSAYPFFLLAEILFQLLPLILCHFQMVFQFCQYIPYCRTNQCKFFREIYFRNSHFLAKVLEIHG